MTKPVNVEWDSTFGIDDVFTGIASRERAHSTSNYIDGVISYAGMLEENDIGAESIPHETEEESGNTKGNAENTGTPIFPARRRANLSNLSSLTPTEY